MADIKFKNIVTITGTLQDIGDLSIQTKQDKVTQEDYLAAMGSMVIDAGEVLTSDGETVDNKIDLRTFYKQINKKGNENPNYTVVNRWLNDKENAVGKRVSISTNFSDNSFAMNGDVIKTASIQGGFINQRSNIGEDRAEFAVDAFIMNDPVEEMDKDDVPTGRYILFGEVADYTGMFFPVRFILAEQKAADYFMNLEKPCLIEIWGDVLNTEVETVKEIESAFGDPQVIRSTRSRKENRITGAAIEPKEMSDELAAAIKKGRSAYEVKLADLESQAKTPNAIGGNTPTKSTGTGKATPKGEYNF